MSTELRDKARAAARRAQEAESYPRRMVEAAELQARSIARIADAAEAGLFARPTAEVRSTDTTNENGEER